MSRGTLRRDRGRFLTDKGWSKLWRAIDIQFPDKRPTLAEISERTDLHINSQAGKFLSPDAISNIVNRRAKADKSSIEALFKAFGLTVEAEDITQDAPYTPSLSADSSFVGREEDLTELDRLVKAGHKAIEIVATGGVGKSRLVQEYLKRYGRDRVLEFNMARESQSVVSPIGIMEEWLKELGEEPGREFQLSKERLRKKLREAKSTIAIFIDNLEPTLENGLFIQAYRAEYVELFRVLTDSQVNSVALITSREPLHESAFLVETYRLKGLDLKARQQYFQSQNVATTSPSIEEMRNAYDGNAEAMKILCGAIRIDYEGNLDACWKTMRQDLLQHKTLEHLVATQFDRLEQTNRDAYNLLCRLGCYRYQDVPLVPEEGVLCLLWDVQEKPWRVLNALKERCLIDSSQQQYSLHPVIREMAIDRLRKNTDDWDKANRQAAEFWTESIDLIITEKDAIQALEAYYHYIEIKDFELAGLIIVDESKLFKEKWRKNLCLYSSLWRFGLFETLMFIISDIINKPMSLVTQSRLYLALGYTQNLIGSLKIALQSHVQSKKLADNYILDNHLINPLGFKFKKYSEAVRLQVVALMNIGCCQLDLLETTECLKSFEIFSHCANVNNIDYLLIDSYYALSLIHSIIGNEEQARYFMNLAYPKLSVTEWSEWSQGYALIFLALAHKNLGEYDRAFQMFDRALQYAEESNYTQVKAKALTGLGELHRIQGDFAQAIPLHQESIVLLDKIRAKCDLAEAYFQSALTYQAMDETEQSQKNFNAALQLFREMNAPKQVNRVQQAMNQSIKLKDKPRSRGTVQC